MAKNHTNYAELGSIDGSSSNQDVDCCCSSQLIDDDIVMIDNNNIQIESTQQTSSSLGKNLNYLQSKLQRLTDQLERIDSMSRSYEHDCHSLRQRLLVEQEQNNQLQKQSELSELRMNELNEELQTTVDNYEKQLQAMSEHMAKLNETLAEQCEQIDVLRYEQNNKFNNSDHHNQCDNNTNDSELNQKKTATTI
ncbi:coiled-coil domain-containing protein, partial [Euroglyphus maynei]